MKKKLSKAKIKRAGEYTTKIFEECVRTVLGLHTDSLEDLQNGMDIIRHASIYKDIYDDAEITEMAQAKLDVDAMYQDKIRELTTKQLQEILEVHEGGGIKRAGKTIETILSELAMRSILGETSESDFRLNNGDVDELGRKSKDNSKKTPNKKRKASKD